MPLGRYAAPCITSTSGNAQWSGSGTNYIVQTPSGVLYCVHNDPASDVAFNKSLDGGLTWGTATVVFSGTITGLSVWYDRWSSISAGLIHCAYTESATDDTLYRTINTESSDALSTQTSIFAGTSTLAGDHLSITRAVGGNVYVKTCIDAGTEGGFFRLPNANVPNGAWDAARTVNEALATNDAMILQPDFDAADTQDILAIFWDTSANEISRQLYDDSANSWAETSIATSMTKPTGASSFPHFACATDIANTQSLLVAWSAVDAANADLRCWTIDSGTISEKTNVVLNSTDDQGLCAIALDTANSIWYVFYGGASAGGDTWGTTAHLYYKASTDSGATWSPETALTSDAMMVKPNPKWLVATPRFTGQWCAAFFDDGTLDRLNAIVPHVSPRATIELGV